MQKLWVFEQNKSTQENQKIMGLRKRWAKTVADSWLFTF